MGPRLRCAGRDQPRPRDAAHQRLRAERPVEGRTRIRAHRARLFGAVVAGRRGRWPASGAGIDLDGRLRVRHVGGDRRADGAAFAQPHQPRTVHRPGAVRVSVPAARRDRARLREVRDRAFAHGRRHDQRRAAQPLPDGQRPVGRAGLHQRQDVRAAGRGDGSAGACRAVPDQRDPHREPRARQCDRRRVDRRPHAGRGDREDARRRRALRRDLLDPRDIRGPAVRSARQHAARRGSASR